MLGMLASQLEAVNGKLKAIEARLMAWHRQNQTSQCLATIPGVGPIAGVSFALKIPDARAFRSARHFAAWIGITPRGNSHDRQTPARQDQPRGRRKPTPAARARRHRGHPAGQKGVASRRGSWDCWRASQKSSQRSRWPTKWPASSGP
jgi:transposase